MIETKRAFLRNGLIFLFNVLCLAAVLFTVQCRAQICNGSFGDPVVNITFGAGSATVAGPLPEGITNYTYVNSVFPQDGFYTVENTTAGVGANTWWPTTDHTGDRGGYMMVVNATLSPTDYFYKQTVSGLCPGTTYEFAAWILNLLPFSDISPPNIVFTIYNTDGTVLGTDTTGQIPINHVRPEWIQYRLVFTTPPGISSVMLKIRDISAGGGPANDIALDDISFRACGPMLSSRFAGSLPGEPLYTCTGDNKTFTLTANVEKASYKNPVYQWQVKIDSLWQNIQGDSSLESIQVMQPAKAGSYAYRMVSSEWANRNSPSCQVASNPAILNVITLSVSAPPVVSILEGQKVIIHTKSTGQGLQYKWTPSAGLDNDTLAEPVASPLVDTEYKLLVSSPHGCTVSTAVKVLVLIPPLIPNAFTPNGDGINDTWVITNIEKRPGCTVKVFNREGLVIFSSTGYTFPWDGTYRGRKVAAGVYYYILDTRDARGIYSGTLTIL